MAILRAAADREDATEKHVVTPGPIVPAREVLAVVLLKEAKAADALRGFETVLTKEPNRYRAFAGAMQAAERAGDAKKAAFFAERVVEQTSAADSPRPGDRAGPQGARPVDRRSAVERWAGPGSSRGAAGDRARLPPPAAGAVESDPLPVPKGGPRERAVTAYNAGVKLLLDKKYGDAQKKFEEALAADEQLAEAHNNLAFSLRMQSAANRDRALKHYDRALAAQAEAGPGLHVPRASSSPRWAISPAPAPTTRRC